MDIQKEGDLFEQWWEKHGQYNRAGGGNYEKTFAWEAWISAKAQAVPEGFVLVEKELPESIAETMALERVNKPFGETDPVWVEITERVYKERLVSKKWELWRDYKAMIEAQEQGQ